MKCRAGKRGQGKIAPGPQDAKGLVTKADPEGGEGGSSPGQILNS